MKIYGFIVGLMLCAGSLATAQTSETSTSTTNTTSRTAPVTATTSAPAGLASSQGVAPTVSVVTSEKEGAKVTATAPLPSEATAPAAPSASAQGGTASLISNGAASQATREKGKTTAPNAEK